MNESEWWDAIVRRRIELLRTGEARCVVEWEGDDPESLFEELVDAHARGAGRILRIGCLAGATIPNDGVDDLVSLDLSRSALDEAGGDRVTGDARLLPFGDGVFDLVCSCPIPGAATAAAFEEIARVLRAGGTLLGIATGEAHRIETQEIFGRGIGWPPAQPARFAIPEAIRAAGLEVSFLAEYFGASYCPDIRSFALDLDALPIIPDFHATKDAAVIREVARKLTCERGIRNTEHMAVYAAWKPA